MKSINKFLAIAVALLAMVAISACSTNDEPVINKYQGNVDTDLLSALARGTEAISLDLDTTYTLEKDYDIAKGIDGEWKNVVYDGWGAGSLIVKDGYVLRPLDLNGPVSRSILYLPWELYCDETGYDKWFEVRSPFEYNAQELTVKIGKLEYNIEKADSTGLNISSLVEREKPTLGLIKFVICYKKALYPFDDECRTVVDTEREGKIIMVKMLREYFGDILDLSKYELRFSNDTKFNLHPIIDLAALEDDLVNGRDEWYSWAKTYYPDSNK